MLLITASAPRSLRSSWTLEEEASPAATRQEEVWPALGDRSLVPMVEQLFSHLLKVLNICAHVLDDVAPGPAVKVTASSGARVRTVRGRRGLPHGLLFTHLSLPCSLLP